eukprot:220167_1
MAHEMFPYIFLLLNFSVITTIVMIAQWYLSTKTMEITFKRQNIENKTINQHNIDLHVCYEWEYYDTHYNMLNYSYNNTISNNQWCDVYWIDVKCNGNNNTFYIDSFIICDIQSFDKNMTKCITGGVSFKFYMILNSFNEFNAYHIEGNVIDLFNGNYVAIIYTGYSLYKSTNIHTNDTISYDLIVRLDFKTFDGTFACRINKDNDDELPGLPDVEYIQNNILYNKSISILLNNNRNSDLYDLENLFIEKYNIDNKYFEYFPFSYYYKNIRYQWVIEDNKQKKYHYYNIKNNKHIIIDNKNIMKNMVLSNLELIKDKWIHFMGKSRTQYFLKKFAHILAKNYNYNLIYKVIGTRSLNTMRSFWYFIDLNLLLTFKGHDHDYNKTTKFWNTTNYFLEIIRFICKSDRLIEYKKYLNRLIPNIVLINKGIHAARKLINKDSLIDYKYEINSYLYYLIQTYLQINSNESLDIYWRRSTITHYNEYDKYKKLPVAWACQSSFRLNCLNRLSDGIINKYIDDYYNHSMINIQSLDDYTLSLGRYDCVGDNRHYLKDNCQETMVYNFLFQMFHQYQL